MSKICKIALSAESWFCKFLTFSYMISVFFPPNWLFTGLKNQLVWKKTGIMLENVTNLQNRVVGRTLILQIFDIILHDFSLFSTQLTLFRPKNSIGLKKRLNSCEKMSKICKITLSADVFKTKQNLAKHSTVHSQSVLRSLVTSSTPSSMLCKV